MAENPYAAPAASVEDVTPQGEFKLAGRMERLGAALVDGLIASPGFYMLGYARLTHQMPSGTAMLFIFPYMLVVLVVNLVLLYRSAQTIGKKVAKIKVARLDGSQAALSRIFWLRGVVNALPGFIPVIGGFYGLVDILFIFGPQRRCIHDYIASTIVIDA